jgi:hypothetical protein
VSGPSNFHLFRPDDSGLDSEQLRAVEARAKRLLDRASAWETFPTPVADILEAANLKIALTSAFDPAAIFNYLQKKTADITRNLKGALDKIWGIYDSTDELIHIDATVVVSKQTFLKLHETAHHELPGHKKMFKFFADCAKNLAPEIADLFERESQLTQSQLSQYRN